MRNAVGTLPTDGRRYENVIPNHTAGFQRASLTLCLRNDCTATFSARTKVAQRMPCDAVTLRPKADPSTG